MGLLTDKVALITGGISGLAEQVRCVMQPKVQVVVADINAERGKNAAEEMSAGGAIEFILVDVTCEVSQQALLMTWLRGTGGSIRCLLQQVFRRLTILAARSVR